MALEEIKRLEGLSALEKLKLMVKEYENNPPPEDERNVPWYYRDLGKMLETPIKVPK